MSYHHGPSGMFSSEEYHGTSGMKIRRCHGRGIFNSCIPVFTIALPAIRGQEYPKYTVQAGCRGTWRDRYYFGGFEGGPEQDILVFERG